VKKLKSICRSFSDSRSSTSYVNKASSGGGDDSDDDEGAGGREEKERVESRCAVRSRAFSSGFAPQKSKHVNTPSRADDHCAGWQ